MHQFALRAACQFLYDVVTQIHRVNRAVDFEGGGCANR